MWVFLRRYRYQTGKLALDGSVFNMAAKYPRRPDIPAHRQFKFIPAAEEFTLSEYENLYGNTLPQVVMITKGGLVGNMEFMKGQVLTIQAVSRQDRVVGRTVTGSYNELYGLPTGTQQSFCVINKEGRVSGKASYLYDHFRNHKPPFRIQFPEGSVLKHGNKIFSTASLPQIDLAYTFEETHAEAHFVVQETVMNEMLYIPFHESDLRIATVVGIDGMAPNIFRKLVEAMDYSCLTYEYDLQYGKYEVAVYDALALQGKRITRCTAPARYASFEEIFDRPFAKQHLEDLNKETTSEEYEMPLFGDDDEGGMYEDLSDLTRQPSTGPETAQKGTIQEAWGGIVSDIKSIAKDRRRRPSPPPITKAKAAFASSLKGNGSKSEDSRLYTNDIPRGSVAPLIKAFTSPDEQKSTAGTVFENTAKVTQGDQKDVIVRDDKAKTTTDELDPYSLNPVDITKLTIDQVCECLKVLKLDNQCATFRDQMVDGEILKELDIDVLVSDFGFKKIEAIRLMKYVKVGHVPT